MNYCDVRPQCIVKMPESYRKNLGYETFWMNWDTSSSLLVASPLFDNRVAVQRAMIVGIPSRTGKHYH